MGIARQDLWKVYERGFFKLFVFADSATEALGKYIEHKKPENAEECYNPEKVELELFGKAGQVLL